MNEQVPALSLQGICKDYHQGRSVVEVLKNIDLTVMPGEMVAIIGASGSGKSTLLHIAGLLDSSDSGTITMEGFKQKTLAEIKNANLIRLKNLGFIYQYHHLLRDFTAQENVAMPMLIDGKSKKESMEAAAELLDNLGLGNRLLNLPGELSGGEQQRVAISRALINNPKIILADEPTGNLDPKTAEEVFELFLRRAEQGRVAVVMVTHNTALANKMHKLYKLDYGLSQIQSNTSG